MYASSKTCMNELWHTCTPLVLYGGEKKKKHLGKDEKLYAAFMDLEKTHERDDRKTL